MHRTLGLGKVIAHLAARPAPVLLDLGAAVGSNIAFFGEQVGCRMLVADLAAEIDRHESGAGDQALARSLDAWFTQPDESVDGVLCWDLFDFLVPEAAAVVAHHVTRVLSANGVVFGMFRTAAPPVHHYTRHVIIDDTHLRFRPYGQPSREIALLENREIIRLFAGLRVSDSFLLQTHVREILFRKPEYLAHRQR